MSLSLKKLKRWFLMVCGKSIFHVKQTLGEYFVPDKLCGYFNNLTEKVLKDDKRFLKQGEFPVLKTEKGETVTFPVAVFQYGLGCYDLFLKTNENVYLTKFLEIAEWALEEQDKDGGWNNFFYIFPEHPFGAMCQGEAASLLVRAYKETGDNRYLDSAKKGIDFLLNNRANRLLTIANDDELILLEYEGQPPVLNGWVFAAFGIYDLWIVTRIEDYHTEFLKTQSTIKKYLPRFDNTYWSMYDLGGRISSPFYHNLHIAQLEALYLVSKEEVFLDYKNRFLSYRNNPFKRTKSFVIKAIQKIKEKG